MPSTSDQAGPVFWGYKSEVSIVGVFGPTPERRALLAWDGAILAEEVTPQFWTMFDATINWLVRGKTNATIVFSQDETGGQSLADHLQTKGYTITTDSDQSIPDTNIVGDLIIKTPTGTGGRFARVAKPVLTYWADSHDDLLVSTIGTTAMFESTNATVVATNHPAAGGLKGSFIVASNSHNWQLIGTLLPNGAITVATFVQPGDPTNRTLPLLVLLNGPNDTPAGSVYGGGPFTGFEGTNFFGGAALNKFDVDGTGTPKTLTLRPIDVTGKQNVKLTIAAAGTYLDFEQSTGPTVGDYLDVWIDTDGNGPNDFVQLINFTAPSGTDKYFDDRNTKPNNPTRLGLEFKDVTYDIPAGATQLIVQIRAFTTWFNEIVGFDNIRITEGAAQITSPQITGISQSGNNVTITWVNGGTLESAPSLAAPITWTSTGDSDGSYTEAVSGNKYFRVRK